MTPSGEHDRTTTILLLLANESRNLATMSSTYQPPVLGKCSGSKEHNKYTALFHGFLHSNILPEYSKLQHMHIPGTALHAIALVGPLEMWISAMHCSQFVCRKIYPKPKQSSNPENIILEYSADKGEILYLLEKSFPSCWKVHHNWTQQCLGYQASLPLHMSAEGGIGKKRNAGE